MAAFREEFAKSKHIVVMTGAGVSAESGVPTFRGAGGFWRKWQAQVVILNVKKAIISAACTDENSVISTGSVNQS